MSSQVVSISQQAKLRILYFLLGRWTFMNSIFTNINREELRDRKQQDLEKLTAYTL